MQLMSSMCRAVASAEGKARGVLSVPVIGRIEDMLGFDDVHGVGESWLLGSESPFVQPLVEVKLFGVALSMFP